MAIPKIIHYCWFGTAPIPKSVQRCINSWKKYCPDFEIRQWSEKDFDISQNPYTQQAYEAKVWGFVPDYIRLWIIYNHGGIYLDTDVQVLKDLSPLCQHHAFAGFEDKMYVNFGQGFGAEPGNPVILAHMRQYDYLQFRNPDGTFNKTASPVYTTQALLGFGMKQDYEGVQDLGDITVYPKEYFCPKDFETGRTNVTENTYSIHQFDATWYTPEEKQHREQLQRQARWNKFVFPIVVFVRNTMGEERWYCWQERLERYSSWTEMKQMPRRIVRKLLGKSNVQE